MCKNCVSYEDYNDMCTECDNHLKCHKYGIDYDKIAKCKKELQKSLKS
jgi:hypothetical protein